MCLAWLRVVSVGAVVLVTGAALADPVVPDEGERPGQHVSGATTAEQGAFLPYTFPARGDHQQAYAWVQGGYDAGRGGAILDSTAQTRIAGAFSLRAGMGYVGPSGAVRPSVALAVDVLHQEAHGLNLAFYGGYQGHGFNTVPALNAVVAVGRVMGPFNVLANLGYGFGLDAGEHYGEVRVASLVRLRPNLHVGLDARGRMDLERDDDEPENEPDWEVLAGPLATLSLDRYTITAGAGVSSIKYRLDPTVTTGLLAQLTVGAAF